MEGFIKVDPRLLEDGAEQLSDIAGQLSAITSTAADLVSSLGTAWTGGAATGYITKLRGQDSSIQTMLRMVREHASDLMAMAQNYSTAESTSEEASAGLPIDIIS